MDYYIAEAYCLGIDAMIFYAVYSPAGVITEVTNQQPVEENWVQVTEEVSAEDYWVDVTDGWQLKEREPWLAPWGESLDLIQGLGVPDLPQTQVWINGKWFPPGSHYSPGEAETLIVQLKGRFKWLGRVKLVDYKERRAAAYPTIQEQLDMLYNLGFDGWKERIAEVKRRFPKG